MTVVWRFTVTVHDVQLYHDFQCLGQCCSRGHDCRGQGQGQGHSLRVQGQGQGHSIRGRGQGQGLASEAEAKAKASTEFLNHKITYF